MCKLLFILAFSNEANQPTTKYHVCCPTFDRYVASLTPSRVPLVTSAVRETGTKYPSSRSLSQNTNLHSINTKTCSRISIRSNEVRSHPNAPITTRSIYTVWCELYLFAFRTPVAHTTTSDLSKPDWLAHLRTVTHLAHRPPHSSSTKKVLGDT